MEGKNRGVEHKNIDQKPEEKEGLTEKSTTFAVDVIKERQFILKFVERKLFGIAQAADIEDIVQQTMVRALQTSSEFREDSKMTTWLVKIAGNLIKDYFRTKSRREKSGLEAVSLQSTGTDGKKYEEKISDYHSGVEQSDSLLMKNMHLAWQELTDKERTLLNYLLQGYELKGIAEKLDVNEATFKTRIFRARKHLQEILTRLGLIP